jgi:hypothetical protein
MVLLLTHPWDFQSKYSIKVFSLHIVVDDAKGCDLQSGDNPPAGLGIPIAA